MPTISKAAAVLFVCGVLLCPRQEVRACPFCPGGSALTLSEEVAAADIAVFARWTGAKKTDEQSAGSTTYEVVKILQQRKLSIEEGERRAGNSFDSPKAPPAAPKTKIETPTNDNSEQVEAPAGKTPDRRVQFQKGDRIAIDKFRTGKPGDLVLLLGTVNAKGSAIDWNAPQDVSEEASQYIAKAPVPDAEPVDRLRYFVKHLEHSDELIAGDAYREFARAPYDQIVGLAKDIPRDNVRRWVTDPETPQVRLGLYGLMLGLCGNADDARLLEEKIKVRAPGDDFRLGIDGVMAGYLLLTGPKGLDLIDETVLSKQTASASDIFSALAALRFIWSSTEGVIERERIRAAARPVLDRPEFFELVLPDLARWEDWSLQDRLMELYGTGEYNVPGIKRAIVRYMIASARHKPKGNDPEPERVAKGKQYLQTLRERDPEVVQNAERFSFSN